MIKFFIFGIFHTVFSAAIGLGIIGLAVDLLCYIASKPLIMPIQLCIWITIVGAVLEAILTVICLFALTTRR